MQDGAGAVSGRDESGAGLQAASEAGAMRPRGRRAGTNWRRFGLVAGPAFAVSCLVLGLTAEGALASSFAVAGTNFKISATKLEAEGLVQYGTVDAGADGAEHPVSVNAFKSAKIYSLCQSMVIPSPFGDMTMRLTAGSDTDPVTATNMVTDLDLLEGDVTFVKPNIGVDASRATKGPITGEKGAFALEADQAIIQNPKIQAWATTAGTFKLKNLRMTASFGKKACF
jgi:hypothetical protein